MRLATCARVLGVVISGGVLFQFGGCLGSVWSQGGIGFGRTLGAVPGAALGDAAFTAIGLGDNGGKVRNHGDSD